MKCSNEAVLVTNQLIFVKWFVNNIYIWFSFIWMQCAVKPTRTASIAGGVCLSCVCVYMTTDLYPNCTAIIEIPYCITIILVFFYFDFSDIKIGCICNYVFWSCHIITSPVILTSAMIQYTIFIKCIQHFFLYVFSFTHSLSLYIHIYYYWLPRTQPIILWSVHFFFSWFHSLSLSLFVCIAPDFSVHVAHTRVQFCVCVFFSVAAYRAMN